MHSFRILIHRRELCKALRLSFLCFDFFSSFDLVLIVLFMETFFISSGSLKLEYLNKSVHPAAQRFKGSDWTANSFFTSLLYPKWRFSG